MPLQNRGFHQHWNNFAETLQFEDLRSKISILFIMCIFVGKKSRISMKCIFYECLKKIKKKPFAEKSFSVLEGAPIKHYIFFFLVKRRIMYIPDFNLQIGPPRIIFNQPNVAGAVLQTASSIIN